MKHILSFLVMTLACLVAMAAPVKKTSSLEKGQDAMKNQQWETAIKYLNAALDETPDYAYAAYASLASVKISQEQPQEAIELMEKAFDNMNETVDETYRAWCCGEMATAYTDTHDLKSALKYMEYACEFQPNDPHYATERAVLLYTLKDRDNANKVAQQALDLGAEGEDAERAQVVIDACKMRAENKTITVVERDLEQTDDAAIPEFPGGREAMKQFIHDNLRYPKKAAKKGITGTVVVECNFDLEGKMIASQVVQELSPECDEEALRVCQAMPQFTPGMYNGKPVWSRLLIQVKFNKTSDKKKEK